MKVGIITKIGKNYGAVLQAYALKRKLCELGADAHIIKYVPANSKRTYDICKYSWGLRGTVANIKAAIHFAKYNESNCRFFDFRNKYYSFLGDYGNDKEIEDNPPLCDIYVAGSDQVWNPNISFDRSYYCMFAEKYSQSRRAAYSASIGLSEIHPDLRAEFKKRVQQFDYISVREKQALSILGDMGIAAELAPDPTLLLSAKEWESLSVNVMDEPYILCYFVSLPAGIERLVDRFKKRYGIKVVNLMTEERSAFIGDVKIRNAGPKEFLGLFANASFVITSSFHGTVFSLINKRNFVVTLYESTKSRVTELLERFDLSERVITPECDDISPYCETPVYSDKHDAELEAVKKQGEKVLNKILGVF